MRVALLTNFVAPYRVPLFEAMSREVDLHVLISTQMESTRDWSVDLGSIKAIKQRTISIPRTYRTARFAEPLDFHIPYDTVAQLRRLRPDVVLTGEMGPRTILAMLYASRTHTPAVLWATLSDELEADFGWVRRLVRKHIISRVRAVIVNGENGARYFHRFGFPDERIARVNQVTDIQPLLDLPLEKANPRRLIHVGSVSERKGLHLLFAALRTITTPVELLLVGDGPMRAELQAQQLPGNITVTWAGSVPYDQLPSYYAQGGIFVFPTLGDEWGLVVNEALAAGLPVLGSTHSQAVEELISSGLNGWRMAPEDPAALAHAVAHALATPDEKLKQMRVAARDSIRNHTPAHAAAQMVQCLQQAVRA